MSLRVWHLRLLALIRDRLAELQKLHGEGWTTFSNALLELLDRLDSAEDIQTAQQVVDEIILHLVKASPSRAHASELMLEAHEAGVYRTPETKRGVTDGEMLAFNPLDSAASESANRSVKRTEIVKIGRALAQDLRAATREGRRKAPRYLNTFFTAPDGKTVVPRHVPLVRKKLYRLCVEVSPEQRGLGGFNEAFPDAALEGASDGEGALPLLVVASSNDFPVKPNVQSLALTREGPSDIVRFSVRPKFAGVRGLIRVEIFYRGHLLQSKRVEAFAVEEEGDEVPDSLRPAQTARVTNTTTELFNYDTVLLTPERVLSIEVERDERDQSVDLRFLDRTRGEEELAYYDTKLSPQSLGAATLAVREQLKTVIEGEVRAGGRLDGYKYVIDGDEALLLAWLPQLADAGRGLYRALLPGGGGGSCKDLGERLRAALQPRAVIQVNPIAGSVTIPWSLLYERPVQIVPGETRLCDKYAEATAPDCPECESLEDPTVVCPYAFWGYRYAIEQLPCWSSGELPQPLFLMRRVSNRLPLLLNLNVWRDFTLWRDHIDRLWIERLADMKRTWKLNGKDLDVIYFYSHGGLHRQQPYLEVSDGKVMSNFLEACNLNWPHNPLVFLNGCSTGDYGPESYLSLIDDFRKAGAAGVVGTECAVTEMFAESYAASLFPRFFRGECLGMAMLDTRLEFLLKKKNPLALVYSLYAANEISLASPVT
jgi:hypothetical protein